MSYIDAVIDQAQADVGVRESPLGSNRGTRVEAMQKVVRIPPGSPWCAAAVAAWGVEALGNIWPLPLTGSCDVLLDFARRRGILHTEPKRGDVFLRLDATDDDDAQHAGIVERAHENGDFDTIEGNTNDGGSREGDGCYERERSIKGKTRYRFVRWIDLLEDTHEPTVEVRVGGDATGGGSTIPAQIIEGRAYAPLRPLLLSLFPASQVIASLGWDRETRQPLWWGRGLGFACLLSESGAALAPVRSFALLMGLEVVMQGQTIRLVRGAA